VPTYTLKDVKSQEEWDVSCSYEELQTILNEMPDVKQVLSFPNMITQHGSTISKTSGDWRDFMKKIDKNAGSKSKVKT
jgi:hypothetical protein